MKQGRWKQLKAQLKGFLHYDNVIYSLNSNTFITQMYVREAKEPKSRTKLILQFPESESISGEHFDFEQSVSKTTGHKHDDDQGFLRGAPQHREKPSPSTLRCFLFIFFSRYSWFKAPLPGRLALGKLMAWWKAQGCSRPKQGRFQPRWLGRCCHVPSNWSSPGCSGAAAPWPRIANNILIWAPDHTSSSWSWSYGERKVKNQTSSAQDTGSEI